jgi:hypothetical protein
MYTILPCMYPHMLTLNVSTLRTWCLTYIHLNYDKQDRNFTLHVLEENTQQHTTSCLTFTITVQCKLPIKNTHTHTRT